MTDHPPPTPPRPPKADGPVDMHVHVVGNGMGGTGCWTRLPLWRRPMAGIMLRQAGLPASALHGDLDRLFADRLLEWVRASSLSAAVILAHDQVYSERGELIEGVGTFHVPNAYVLELARQHGEFLPAISIHPARPDALEELERCLAGGAVMMKILPNCQNIDCNDRRYRRFWERMAAARLPLLAHTGGEHTVQVIRREFADPRVLRLPLECGVTVIAGHCATKSGLFDPDYFSIFASMVEQYPNLYGDTSAFGVPIRGRRVPVCLQEPVRSRMVHGSDFPVPISAWYPWARRFISWSEFRQCQNTRNPLERDYQMKRAMGFPDEYFTRIRSLLRQL